ncbi:hypothetical protein KL918_004343 [Ogataea parapolymorpha]|nr:hypothetical protein KL918_004343 [Ogataea parapolymorpha]KAG7872017.1 hypothetical protein KL916_003355 [Ogataea parapolymorpha]KAG7878868.1 hypothetical protein KL938_004011 [Ogataea parapolymorpha]
MSYYDIDDILADSQVSCFLFFSCNGLTLKKLPCKFSITIPGLGYLNGEPGCPIKENVRLELPIWLAEILAICSISNSSDYEENDEYRETTFLKLLEPEFFSPVFLNFIKSDALRLNLNPYMFYYRIVTKWSNMFGDAELVELISKALVDRASELNDLSFKLNDHFRGGNLEFMNNLDSYEKQLFKNSHKSYKDLKIWWLKKPN